MLFSIIFKNGSVLNSVEETRTSNHALVALWLPLLVKVNGTFTGRSQQQFNSSKSATDF